MIAKREKEKAELEEELGLAGADFEKVMEISEKIGKIDEELNRLYDEFMELSEESEG